MKTLGQCLIFLTALLAGYQTALAEEAASIEKDPHQAHRNLDWPGIYNGLLPCDDCYGIKTSLALNKNGSYILITQKMGQSPRDFVEKGKFTWGNQSNTIILTPRNSGLERHYAISENTLTQLDEHGNRFTKQADRYVLRRTDTTAEPSAQQHSGH